MFIIEDVLIIVIISDT